MESPLTAGGIEYRALLGSGKRDTMQAYDLKARWRQAGRGQVTRKLEHAIEHDCKPKAVERVFYGSEKRSENTEKDTLEMKLRRRLMLRVVATRFEAIDQNAVLEAEFNRLTEKWYAETGMVSMIHKKAMHAAYQRIIGMGKEALPFIFRELSHKRGHWLWALCSITGQDAAKPTDNIKQAIESWLNWGRENGYL